MRIYEMQNLFIAYNKDEDFRILICALDKYEADELARGYALDAHLEGKWEISEPNDNINNIHFDCDYVISGGQ